MGMVQRAGVLTLAVVVLALVALPAGTAPSPLDLPDTTEPRVAVGKSLSGPGFRQSQGVHEPFERVRPRETIFSRDVLVALPGFQADVVPNSKGVKLTLYGNLPEMSESPVLESAVIMHDTSAYDADFTLLRGRVVLTNNKDKGEATVWLRTALTGVKLTLPEPGDSAAIEIYGRWAPGVPFRQKKVANEAPVLLWDAFVLKGKLDIKTGKNEFHMSAPPGRAYFHGDSVHGPSPNGPQPLKELPLWANDKAKKPEVYEKVKGVVEQYAKLVEETEPSELLKTLLAAAEKDKDKERGVLMRRLIVYALAAMDDVHDVAKMLNESKHDEVRKAAVIALRHWIGARVGRDEKLYVSLQEEANFAKPEATTILQMLHSPFDPHQPETYEALIAYLKHRKQAIRELAHWHLVRLAPAGRKIPFDASAPEGERDKSGDAWEKLIPAGKLPPDPEEEKEKDKK